MLLYRSLSLGFLGACLLLLATRTPVVIERVVPAQSAHTTPCPPIPPGPTLIDVAPNTTPDGIARLLRLAPEEQIIAVDDVQVSGTVGAGVVLAQTYLSSRRYLDVEVRGPAGERRILVLVH